MHKLPLLLSIFSVLLCSDQSFDAFKTSQTQAFKQKKIDFINFKKAEDEAFENHLKEEKKIISAYKEKVKAYWPEADLTDEKKFVAYSKDLKTQSTIDFENNEIIISYLSDDDKKAKKELFDTLDKTLRLDNIKAFNESQLEQDINNLSAQSKYIKDANMDGQKLLETPFSQKKVNSKNIKLSKNKNVHTIKYTLPKDATYKRSYNYLVQAKSNAQRFNLKAQWLLAIMHSESSFNPMARSWVPAYGLMQIVPKTAGIDSYMFLYKKRRLLSASYLYNTKNNIETGSAYFHILYYKYLSHIKNPTSRLYCAIAGYNTGAGNVARAFVGTNSVKKAAVLINKMSPEKVYNYLLSHLRYDEPKHYLKRVRARSQKYKDLYKL